MTPDTPSPNGSAGNGASEKALPPVEAPSAKLIIQLFLVPGILVAVVIGFILLFFGGLGTGPQTPADFLSGLNNPSELKRWKTAQDLAQVLPRKPELRQDVKFALDVSDLLQREMSKPPPTTPTDPHQEQADLLEYLPAVVGNVVAPVGLPLLHEIIALSHDKVKDEGYRRRLRNAIVAVGFLGARVKEFDHLTPEGQGAILDGLEKEAGPANTGRQAWASFALNYLKQRQKPGTAKPTAGVGEVLAVGARSPDELTRKFTVMALANWDDPGAEPLLRQLSMDNTDVTMYEDDDQARGQREIRLNAALALARRGNPDTPWSFVVESLDEQRLNQQYKNNPNVAVGTLLKGLNDLYELKTTRPNVFKEAPGLQTAVEKLAESPTMAVQVNARRILGSTVGTPGQAATFSQQIQLMLGLSIGIAVLLGIAVIARWKRSAPPEVLSSTTPGESS